MRNASGRCWGCDHHVLSFPPLTTLSTRAITSGVRASCASTAFRFSSSCGTLLAPSITVLTRGFFKHHAMANTRSAKGRTPGPQRQPHRRAFQCEWHDDSGNWYRSYGNENWEFDEHGLMRKRFASINDLRITEAERKFR